MTELQARIQNLSSAPLITLEFDYMGWQPHAEANGYSQRDWNQCLITKMNQLSANMRNMFDPIGGTDCLIVGMKAAEVIETLEYFLEDYQTFEDIEQIGVVSGRYHVFVDLQMPPNQIISGRGSDMFKLDKEATVGVINIQNL